jgi:beta-lactamase class A
MALLQWFNPRASKSCSRSDSKVYATARRRAPKPRIVAVFALALAVCLSVVSTSHAQTAPQEQARGASTSTADLQKKLDAIAAAHHGHVALYAKNLTTGETVAIDSHTPVQTASVIKMALMLQAFEQVKAGKLKLSQPLVLTKENQVGGSGILYLMDPGLSLTLKDVIALMMTLSDNTATNMLIDTVGLAPTNAMLARMGLPNTYFYKKVFKPAEGPMPADQKKFGLGKTTAEEMARVLESIYRCDLGDRDLCAQMMFIMRNQQDRDMAPRYFRNDSIDGGYATADKIGALDEVRADVALTYTVRGPVLLSIFTYDNADTQWTPDNEGERTIGRLAQTIVDAWSPEGLVTKVTDSIAPSSATPSPSSAH